MHPGNLCYSKYDYEVTNNGKHAMAQYSIHQAHEHRYLQWTMDVDKSTTHEQGGGATRVRQAKLMQGQAINGLLKLDRLTITLICYRINFKFFVYLDTAPHPPYSAV